MTNPPASTHAAVNRATPGSGRRRLASTPSSTSGTARPSATKPPQNSCALAPSEAAYTNTATTIASITMTAASTAAKRPSTASNADATPVSWASASAHAIPHDSDEAANNAGSHGVDHRGTAPRLWSRSPVYTMTTAATSAVVTWRMRTRATFQVPMPSHAKPSAAASARDPTARYDAVGCRSSRITRSALPRSASKHTMPSASSTNAAANPEPSSLRYAAFGRRCTPGGVDTHACGTSKPSTESARASPAPVPPRNR